MFINFTAKIAIFEDSNDGNRLVKILDIKTGHQQNFHCNFIRFNGFSKTVIQRHEIVNMVLRHINPNTTEIGVEINSYDIPKFDDQIIETFKVLTGHNLKIEDFEDYCHWRGCGRGKLLNPTELVKV